MPFFIATVYMAPGVAIEVDGAAAVKRYVIREQAETPTVFAAQIRDRYVGDHDAVVEFGPIGLSKRQD